MRRRERGSPAHFIGATECWFHRNTLVDDKVIVSTVGQWHPRPHCGIEPVGGFGDTARYYETMVFFAKPGCPYRDADVGRGEVRMPDDLDWTVCEVDGDLQADAMHEKVVEWVLEALPKGLVQTYREGGEDEYDDD